MSKPRGAENKGHRLENETDVGPDPSPTPMCEASEEWLSLPVPQSLHLQNGDSISTHLLLLLGGVHSVIL